MEKGDKVKPSLKNDHTHRVVVPPPQPFLQSLRYSMRETFFPDDPLRQFKDQRPSISRKLIMGFQYFFPILECAPYYGLEFLKGDLIAGIIISILCIPQGIGNAHLANLPPIIGLYSSCVPPLIYALMGSSRELIVGTVAVVSLLTSSLLGAQVDANQNPTLFLHLTFTATFFAGVFQAALGALRLGVLLDFLSQAAIVGFMGGVATVVCLQQLKGILGLKNFTHKTDILSVMRYVFTHTHEWRWESIVMGCSFIIYLLLARYIGKKRANLFWVSAMAPLTCVISGSLIAYFTNAQDHGVEVIEQLKKGLNPPSVVDLTFASKYLSTTIKAGIVIGIVSLAQGVAVGRSFSMFKNYHIDANREMIAFGMMNIVGSFTSCYPTLGSFSLSAVNFNARGKTTASNIVMGITVMIVLLFLTPYFKYTPVVVISATIMTAVIGLVDYETAIHMWHVDKWDFMVCICAYIGMVFGNIETGLIAALGLSVLRLVFFVARPRTVILGNIPDSEIYRSIDQYPDAKIIPGILILEISAPIYFANSGYLRERILRWIDEEEDKQQSTLHYVILDMGAVGNIDTSGISMFNDLKKGTESRGLKLMLANPGSEVMKKLNKSKVIDSIGEKMIYLTVGEAVRACKLMLYTSKPRQVGAELEAAWSDNIV